MSQQKNKYIPLPSQHPPSLSPDVPIPSPRLHDDHLPRFPRLPCGRRLLLHREPPQLHTIMRPRLLRQRLRPRSRNALLSFNESCVPCFANPQQARNVEECITACSLSEKTPCVAISYIGGDCYMKSVIPPAVPKYVASSHNDFVHYREKK